jgi:hypothetical protein
VSALAAVRDGAGAASRRLVEVTEALSQASRQLKEVFFFVLRSRPYVCSAGGRLRQPYSVGGPHGGCVCRGRETSDITCRRRP